MRVSNLHEQGEAADAMFVSIVDMHRKAIESPGVVLGHKVEDPSQMDFASMRITSPHRLSRRHRTVGCRRLLSRLLFLYSSDQEIARIVRVFGRV